MIINYKTKQFLFVTDPFIFNANNSAWKGDKVDVVSEQRIS
jgi:hypothetical protein